MSSTKLWSTSALIFNNGNRIQCTTQKSFLIFLNCKCPIMYKGQGRTDGKELNLKIPLKIGTKDAILWKYRVENEKYYACRVAEDQIFINASFKRWLIPSRVSFPKHWPVFKSFSKRRITSIILNINWTTL